MPTLKQLTDEYWSLANIPQDLLYAGLSEEKERLAALDPVELRNSPIGQYVTHLSKTDLFWMCRYFTWETNPVGAGEPIDSNFIIEDPYRVVCDLFVKKNPALPLNKQDKIKTRLLLWPRGGMKSTIDVVDTVQWILNFPDIRILFLTAADELAMKFVEETKGHFVARASDQSLMQIFFPEFCVSEGNRESAFEFSCPVWLAKGVKRGEPTVLASSVGSTKSGLHFELIKADDSVSDKNSETGDQCRKISHKLSLTRKLLRLGGYYFDFIGTRYDDDDHYGLVIEKNVGELTTIRGRCWALTENSTTDTKVLIGRGIQIKPEVAERLVAEGREVDYAEAGKDGCDLLIPHVMPYEWCMKEWRENETIFEAQINQNPRPLSKIVFERKDLIAATVRFDQMPFNGPRSQTWDFAYSAKKGRDFVTACSGIWNIEKGQLFVQDMIRSRFRPNDLAQAVVDLARKWLPFVIGIENSNGADYLDSMIIDKARATGDEHVLAVCSKIDWFKVNTENDAKRARMGSMHPWIMEGRLKFANYLECLETLYSEFEYCMTSKSARNDIPDVISQQLRYAPQIVQMSAKHELFSWSPGEAGWNMIFEGGDQFGRPGWAAPPPPAVEIEPQPDVVRSPYAPGVDNILGDGIVG